MGLKIQNTFVMFNYQKKNNSNPKYNLDIGKLAGAFKEYQEEKSKMLTGGEIEKNQERGDFKSYLENKEKMINFEEEDYWFSKNKNIKSYEDYLYNLEKQLEADEVNTKNYYGVISFTTEQMKLMGIDRYDLKLEDVKYMKGIINNALGDLGRYHFKEGYEEFNSLSIFHNNKKHFHAHINFSSSIKQDKIPIYRIARIHLKIAEGMVSRMNLFQVQDKDFRNKEIDDEDIDIYKSAIDKLKALDLKNFRYDYLSKNEKEKVDEIYEREVSRIFDEEFRLLKEQYDNILEKHLEIEFKEINSAKKKYEELTKNYIKSKYLEDKAKKEKIIKNKILKDLKESSSEYNTKKIYAHQEKFIKETNKEEKDLIKKLDEKAKGVDTLARTKKYKRNIKIMKNIIPNHRNEIDVRVLENMKLKYMNQLEKEELFKTGELTIK